MATQIDTAEREIRGVAIFNPPTWIDGRRISRSRMAPLFFRHRGRDEFLKHREIDV